MGATLRALLRDKVATGVVVLTLGLGIGASTAVFAVISSTVLRPLPVPEPERLARLYLGDETWEYWTHPIWEELDRRSDGTFAGVFASGRTTFDTAVGGESQFVEGLWASAGFFEVLGTQPILGRAFTRADGRRGCGRDGPVVVISHRLWLERFGGSAAVVGSALTLSGVPFTVVGVMASGFFGPTVGRAVDAVVPLSCEPVVRGRQSQVGSPWHYWLNITFRLRPEQTLAGATTILRTWQPVIREVTTPDQMTASGREQYLRAPMVLLRAGTGGTSILWQRYRTPLLALFVISGLLLAVACANVANLMLARSVTRRSEFSLRVALGATASQVARLVLLECVLLSAAGGALGLIAGHLVTQVLVRELSLRTGEVFVDVTLDWRVVAFAVVTSVGVTFLCGGVPAVRAGRSDPQSALAEQGRLAHGSGGGRLHRAILMAQVAVALVLVVSAGLFIRTFTTLMSRDAGVDADRVLLVTPHAFGDAAAIASEEQLRRYGSIVAAIRDVPGVSQAAVSFPTPVSTNEWRVTLQAGDAPSLSEDERWVDCAVVSPDWFATYGVRVLQGRDFRADDLTALRPVVIVNEAFVSRFMGNSLEALGETIGLQHEPEQRYVVVGVVGNVVFGSLRDQVRPAIYLPLGRGGRIVNIRGALAIYTPLSGVRTVAVRAEQGTRAAAVAGSVVDAVRSVAPTVTSTTRTLAGQMASGLRQERLTAVVAGLFGGMGVVLAMVGLYGVTLLTMRRRRVEFGIRMALGATRGHVLRSAVWGVCVIVSVGSAIGGLASLGVGRSVETLLYGVEPHDPAALVLGAGGLAVVSVVAGLVAAIPVTRVEPAEILRRG